MTSNRKYVLAVRPMGQVKATDFRMETEKIPEPAEREVLMKVRYVSVDPYMRNRMNHVKSYVPPYEMGEVMGGDGIGEVVASGSERY